MLSINSDFHGKWRQISEVQKVQKNQKKISS